MLFGSRRLSPLSYLCGAIVLAIVTTCTGQTVTPPESTFFSTVAEEAYSTYQLSGDGDLWQSCGLTTAISTQPTATARIFRPLSIPWRQGR